ncbi:hypothetical protein TB2_047232 [Malus domestica]
MRAVAERFCRDGDEAHSSLDAVTQTPLPQCLTALLQPRNVVLQLLVLRPEFQNYISALVGVLFAHHLRLDRFKEGEKMTGDESREGDSEECKAMVRWRNWRCS